MTIRFYSPTIGGRGLGSLAFIYRKNTNVQLNYTKEDGTDWNLFWQKSYGFLGFFITRCTKEDQKIWDDGVLRTKWNYLQQYK